MIATHYSLGMPPKWIVDKSLGSPQWRKRILRQRCDVPSGSQTWLAGNPLERGVSIGKSAMNSVFSLAMWQITGG